MDKKTLQDELNALGQNHEYMSPQQQALFKEHLLTLQAEADATHDKNREAYRNIDRTATDPLDRAAINDEQESLLREFDNLRSKKNQIQHALKLLRDGDYGYCEKCGEDIGLPRLIAVPFSTRDADCEHIHFENLKRRTGNPYAILNG